MNQNLLLREVCVPVGQAYFYISSAIHNVDAINVPNVESVRQCLVLYLKHAVNACQEEHSSNTVYLVTVHVLILAQPNFSGNR